MIKIFKSIFTLTSRRLASGFQLTIYSNLLSLILFNMSSYRCYTVNKYEGLFIPVMSTHDIGKTNQNITTAIVAIHGLNENVDGAFNSLMQSVRNWDSPLDPSSVLVVVPWFHRFSVKSDVWSESCTNINPTAQSYAWSGNSSWISGGDSSPVNTPAANLTSVAAFTVLDDLYDSLTAAGVYPSLRRISYVGFSAGGQMVNRYAWATERGRRVSKEVPPPPKSRFQFDEDKTPSVVKVIETDLDKVPVRFVVSDASSYVYFDNTRPALTCRDNRNTGSKHNCSSFVETTADTCNQFNVWKYGTVVLPGAQDGVSYLQSLAGSPSKVAAHTEHYRHKDIRYVFGALDTCNCKTEGYVNAAHCDPGLLASSSSSTSYGKSPKSHDEKQQEEKHQPMCITPNSADAILGSDTGVYSDCCDTYPDALNNDLSASCGSNLQGTNRLQRGLNYMSYLQDFYSRADMDVVGTDSAPVAATSAGSSDRLSVGMRGAASTASHDDKVTPPPGRKWTPVYKVVPGLQHDMVAFFEADVVQGWLLDYPQSAPPKVPKYMHDISVPALEFLLVVAAIVMYLYGMRLYMQARNNRELARRGVKAKGPGQGGLDQGNEKEQQVLNGQPTEATPLL